MPLIYFKPTWLRRCVLVIAAVPLFFAYVFVIFGKALEEDMPCFFSDLIAVWKGKT